MIHLWLLGIFKEEYTTDEAIEPIANPEAVLVSPTLKGFAYLLLSVVFCLQVVEAIGTKNKEVLANIRCMHAKETIEHTVVDEGLGEESFSEGKTKVFYLFHRHRQCG